MKYDYEIAVIGGGPGGYVAAIKAAQKGRKTCIIESRHFGGTCLNEGCIPTKVFIKAAAVLEEIRQAEQFGVSNENCVPAISMEKLQARRKAVVNQLVNGVQGLLRMNRVEMIRGTASFLDPHTVQVGDQQITAEYFIIATGSKAIIPSFIKIEGKNNILTSTEVLELESLPESVAIIGGGVIGMEFAHFFSKAGCRVTVIEWMDHVLPMVDEEISNMVQRQMKRSNVTFALGAKVKKIQNNAVVYEQSGEEITLEATAVVLAVGRVPNTDDLDIASIGVEMEKNAVKTDRYLRTSIENIYAIGDVNGKAMLAHTASHEGLTAVEHICKGQHKPMHYDYIPSCIYLEPEIASVGDTEEQAREKYGDDVKIGRFPMMANGKSLIEGSAGGMFKVVIHGKTGQILGAHLYGSHVTEMIGELAAVMASGVSAADMLKVIHPHPSVNEAVGEMFLSACDGSAIHAR